MIGRRIFLKISRFPLRNFLLPTARLSIAFSASRTERRSQGGVDTPSARFDICQRNAFFPRPYTAKGGLHPSTRFTRREDNLSPQFNYF